MNWQELCEEPTLQNLPYKIELNQQGQIIMSPTSIMHVVFQGKIIALLNRLCNDHLVVPEFPVETSDGVKVIDVAMLTPEQTKHLDNTVSSAFASTLCIEVLSPSNTDAEMEQKKRLYFGRGATEFWTCGQNGQISFHSQKGQLLQSELVDKFPHTIQS